MTEVSRLLEASEARIMVRTDQAEAHSQAENGLSVSTPMKEEIERALEPLVEPPKRQKALTAVMRAVSESYAGPLPHPSHYQGFEDVLPGSANRILTMAEKQQDLRIWWEKFAIKAQFCLALVGLILAFLVSIGLIVGAVYLGISGHEWLGGALVATSAVGMATAFIKGRNLFSPPTSEEPAEALPPQQPRKQPPARRAQKRK